MERWEEIHAVSFPQTHSFGRELIRKGAKSRGSEKVKALLAET